MNLISCINSVQTVTNVQFVHLFFFSIYVVQLQERIPTKADPSAKMPAKAGPSATSMNQVEGRSVKKDAQISCWWNQCCICRFSFY